MDELPLGQLQKLLLPRLGILQLLALALVAPAISACGRVGPPMPPAGVPNVYPKAYPSVEQH